MRSPKADIRYDSERWVANWLEDLGQTFEYERDMGGPRPDFVCPRQGEPVVAIEEEDLSLSREAAQEYKRKQAEAIRTGSGWCNGYDPFPAVRKKIEKARQQLRGCKDIPCLLVLYDSTGTHSLNSNWVIFGAMLGGPAIQIEIGRRDASGKLIVQPGETKTVWADGGKVINHRSNRPQNTTISAISVLSWKSVLLHRYGRTDDYKEPCMDIYMNPFARIRWPDNMVGQHDRVHEWSPDTGLISVSYDGLASQVAQTKKKLVTEYDHILREIEQNRDDEA